MADKDRHHSDKPAIDFGRGSREQSQSGTNRIGQVEDIDPLRRDPEPKKTSVRYRQASAIIDNADLALALPDLDARPMAQLARLIAGGLITAGGDFRNDQDLSG
jgi:hypothetical protein